MKYKKIVNIAFFLIVSWQISFASSVPASQFVKEADLYKQNNEYVNAFQFYIKGLIAALETDDYRMAMKCYGNLSIIYHDFGDIDNSLFFAHKGYDIASRYGYNEQITFLSNFVSFYSEISDTANASKYYRLLGDMLPKDKSVKNGYFFIYERARLERAKKQYDKAEASHAEARLYAIDHNVPAVYVLFQDSEIGNLMIKKGDWDKALCMGRKCLAAAEKISEKDMIINSYKMIADAFSGLDIKDSSDIYMRKYYKLKNEVYDMSGFFRAQNNITQYKDNKAMGRINKLSTMLISGLAVILIFIVLTVALIKKNISLRKAQRLIIDKDKELNEAEAKDHMLRERYVAMREERDKAVGGVMAASDQKCDEGEVVSDAVRDIYDDQYVKDIQDKLLCKIVSVFEDVSVISDPDFSLSAMAERVESNTKYVSVVINRTYHKNFKALLNEYRVKEACRRMTDSDYDCFTIKAIACDVGFRNTVSFIRCFKNVMGMTPSIYQKLSKER